MIFLNLVFKNLFRNKKKFLLFILGFSIIFFILIFSFLSSESFKYQLNDECTISGDFIVEPTVDSDNIKFSFDGPSFNYRNPYPYNQSFLKYYFQSLKNISGVSNLFYIINEASEDYEVCNLFYVNSSDLSRLKLHMVNGKFFSNSSQVIIEKGFADEENLKVGENFSLKKAL